MKKNVYVLLFSAMAAGAACSRIDTNTANTVPTSDSYAATVTAAHAGAGNAATPADAYISTGSAGNVPGTMMYGARAITEASFLMEAASSSMMEVQLGKLALERSSNPEVKALAQMLIDHHTKVNQELADISSGMNVELPSTLMPDHQKLVDKLSKLTGGEFDEKYVDELEDAHERDIALFEVVSNGAQTTTVKAFAIRTLPVLRVHEHQADKLEEKVNK
ncbi:DUF4142 domain-containing protein [Rufibacter immobilis]|uniref:DUF4142 domain-containing protein n=1 Tax=Rufibacter immobilis TaxID=1348778 RepID=A0A3M9MXC0_9BACT|nr:DUF4142 domain-containing protein [Rufibacter immobilis]RNI30179.1 DUF4142 domain-containing protein [Rufibacter immobilis]